MRTPVVFDLETVPLAQDAPEDKDTLNAWNSRIICAGVKVNGEETVVLEAFNADEEPVLLLNLFNIFSSLENPVLIGHGIIRFDIPMLLGRSLPHGIRPPRCIPRDLKPWSDAVFDTMIKASGCKWPSLEELCLTLGVKNPKVYTKDKTVAELYAAGMYDHIVNYCKADVIATAQCNNIIQDILYG